VAPVGYSSPRFKRYYGHTTTALAPHLGLLQRPAPVYCYCIFGFAHARGRCPPLMPGRSSAGVVPRPAFTATEARLGLSQVDSLSLTLRAAYGCLSRCCSAHRLPLSRTSALVSDPGGSPIAGLLTRCAHWSPLCQRRRQSTRKNFRGSIPRLWCSLSTLHASLTTDDA